MQGRGRRWMKLKNLFANSYSRRFFTFIFSLILIQICVLFLVILYGRLSLDIQIDSVADNILEVFDNYLADVTGQADTDMRSVISNFSKVSLLSNSNENSRIIAASSLMLSMNSRLGDNGQTDAYIIYNGPYDMFLLSRSSRLGYSQTKGLQEYVRQMKDVGTPSDIWMIETIGDDRYLLRYSEYNDCVFLSAFLVETLASLSPYHEVFDETQRLFLWNGEERITTVGNEEDFGEQRVYAKEKNTVIPNITVVYEKKYGRDGFGGSVLSMIVLICVCALLVIWLFLRYMDQEVIRPADELIKTAVIVSKGDYGYKAVVTCQNEEFRKLAEAVNHMIETIIRQRIASYEQIIERKEMELKCLQMQIRPHYFLNALSTISSMSYNGENEKIRQFSASFSKHIRYRFTAGFHTVLLSREIESLNAYIACQELLYPDCLYTYFDISQEALDWKIPQMLLHTFVENVYKHTVSLDKMVSLFLHAEVAEREGEKILYLVVEDDGCGFGKEGIDRINHFVREERSRGERIGLLNIAWMLRLLYHRQDLLLISNRSSGGSRIEVWIPSDRIFPLCGEKDEDKEETDESIDRG